MPQWLKNGLRKAFINKDVNAIKAYQELLFEVMEERRNGNPIFE